MRVDHALFVVNEFPSPVRSGAHLRNLQLIAAARAALSTVTVFSMSHGAPPSSADDIHWTCAPHSPSRTQIARSAVEWLKVADGHPSDYLWNQEVGASLAALLDREKPDVAILCELHTRRTLEVLKGKISSLVYDAPVVMSSLVRALVGPRAPQTPAIATALTERTHQVEEALAGSVDQIWVCSTTDRHEMLGAHPQAAAVTVVPNTVDPPSGPAGDARRGDRFRVVFCAAFEYPPNARAATWLGRTLLPTLRTRVPTAELVLVGSGSLEVLKVDLGSSPTALTATGAVKDTAPFVAQADAVVIPLREGGGTRYKVLEAASLSVPIVSTMKGVEGLGLVPGEHFLAAEAADEFADSLARLRSDPDLGEALAERAFEHVRTHFFFDTARREVRRALAELTPRPS